LFPWRFGLSSNRPARANQLNYLNLIEYHKKELQLLNEGASCDKLFSYLERKKLRKLGIIDYIKREWIINQEVKAILEKSK
jgi:hypothetical protein